MTLNQNAEFDRLEKLFSYQNNCFIFLYCWKYFIFSFL